MAGSLLITGASGYVGRSTFETAIQAGYTVVGAYHSRPMSLPGGAWAPLDLSDDAGVARLVIELRPTAIIHAGAAWRTPEEARATIVQGTKAIASASELIGARLIHLSTDVVFDGEHAPYRESDPPAPLTFYAAAKAAAEGIVARHPNAVAVRTSLVTCFDPPDRSTELVLRALKDFAEARTGDDADAGGSKQGRTPSQPPPPHPVTLFTDEYRCPIRTEDLASALVELVEHRHRGVLHVAGPERLSRYEIGLRIAAYHGFDPASGILPGTVAASGLIRPRDCTLDTTLAQRLLRTPLRPLPDHR
jgi:dTDP-4-dehydrorhamnose reductase